MSWHPTPENPKLGNFCIRHLESVAPFSDSVWLKVEENGSKSRFQIEVEEKASCRCVTVSIPHAHCKLLGKFLHFKAYQKGFRYVRRHLFQPELLHLHVAQNLGLLALYWKWRYRLPYVLSEHSSIYLQHPAARLKPLWRRVANEAACMLPVSTLLGNAMREKGIHAPMEIIPNVLNENYLKAFPHGTLSQEGNSQEAQSQEEGCRPFRLLHVSTLSEVKNFNGILHVMERLQNETGYDFELNVVHDFPADGYRQWVQQHNLQEKMHFCGAKNEDELLQFYAKSDALVMFSHLETFSCTVMEAVGVGIPVIATRTGAIPEMLADGRGIVVEPDDEEALYNAIIQLMKNGLPLDVPRQKAYARAASSMETVGRRILEVYQKVLSCSNK